MPKTILNETTYPNENQDPHYTTLVNFYNQNDLIMWNNKLRSNFILAGGGTLTWDAGNNLLSWTADFAIKHITTGFVVQYRYGTDLTNRELTVTEGQLIYGEFPSSLSENQVRHLLNADSLDKEDNYYVLAWRWGNQLYFNNGIVL